MSGAKYVWLSPQGGAPVYVERALLTNGMIPHFTRSFNGEMAEPPRVLALERPGPDPEPVYLVNVPAAILTMLLDILAHPQLKYHYSVDKSGGVQSIVRREYLRYYGVYSLKREYEDGDEAEERKAKKARLDEEAAYDEECLKLYKYLEAGHPDWNYQFIGATAVAEFINSYGIGKDARHGPNDLTNYLEIDGKKIIIACHFFMNGHEKSSRFEKIADGQRANVLVDVKGKQWERDITEGMRRVTGWPAITMAKELDPKKHEIIRVAFMSCKK